MELQNRQQGVKWVWIDSRTLESRKSRELDKKDENSSKLRKTLGFFRVSGNKKPPEGGLFIQFAQISRCI